MNDTLTDIFGSLIIPPEQQMRLRQHQAEFRTAMREQAAIETRADQVRHKLDQQNREFYEQHSNAISAEDQRIERRAFQCGMGCMVIEGDGA